MHVVLGKLCDKPFCIAVFEFLFLVFLFWSYITHFFINLGRFNVPCVVKYSGYVFEFSKRTRHISILVIPSLHYCVFSLTLIKMSSICNTSSGILFWVSLLSQIWMVRCGSVIPFWILNQSIFICCVSGIKMDVLTLWSFVLYSNHSKVDLKEKAPPRRNEVCGVDF